MCHMHSDMQSHAGLTVCVCVCYTLSGKTSKGGRKVTKRGVSVQNLRHLDSRVDSVAVADDRFPTTLKQIHEEGR